MLEPRSGAYWSHIITHHQPYLGLLVLTLGRATPAGPELADDPRIADGHEGFGNPGLVWGW